MQNVIAVIAELDGKSCTCFFESVESDRCRAWKDLKCMNLKELQQSLNVWSQFALASDVCHVTKHTRSAARQVKITSAELHRHRCERPAKRGQLEIDSVRLDVNLSICYLQQDLYVMSSVQAKRIALDTGHIVEAEFWEGYFRLFQHFIIFHPPGSSFASVSLVANRWDESIKSLCSTSCWRPFVHGFILHVFFFTLFITSQLVTYIPWSWELGVALLSPMTCRVFSRGQLAVQHLTNASEGWLEDLLDPICKEPSESQICGSFLFDREVIQQDFQWFICVPQVFLQRNATELFLQDLPSRHRHKCHPVQ